MHHFSIWYMYSENVVVGMGVQGHGCNLILPLTPQAKTRGSGIQPERCVRRYRRFWLHMVQSNSGRALVRPNRIFCRAVDWVHEVTHYCILPSRILFCVLFNQLLDLTHWSDDSIKCRLAMASYSSSSSELESRQKKEFCTRSHSLDAHGFPILPKRRTHSEHIDTCHEPSKGRHEQQQQQQNGDQVNHKCNGKGIV